MSKTIDKIKRETFFRRLIDNDTGTSSKSFFLIVVTIIGCLLLMVPLIVLMIEGICNHTISTDLTGMAAYITSVGTLFATAGITKVWGEKFERNRQDQKEKEAKDECENPEHLGKAI